MLRGTSLSAFSEILGLDADLNPFGGVRFLGLEFGNAAVANRMSDFGFCGLGGVGVNFVVLVFSVPGLGLVFSFQFSVHFFSTCFIHKVRE